MASALKFRLAATLGRRLLDVMLSTVRFEFEDRAIYDHHVEPGRGAIFVLWHGRLLPLTFAHRGCGHATLVSRSRDGEHLARALAAWGFLPVRGSSSRGGAVAVRELVREGLAGRSAVLTPDGPRGPRQKMKLGALYAAQQTGLPLIPVSAACSSAWCFDGGWDRFLVPKPWSRVRIAYAAPYFVPADADEAELLRHATAVETILDQLTERLDASV
jgi:lysophospholipid acyltransferase (LPLAT)-like uncharacterized protein